MSGGGSYLCYRKLKGNRWQMRASEKNTCPSGLEPAKPRIQSTSSPVERIEHALHSTCFLCAKVLDGSSKAVDGVLIEGNFFCLGTDTNPDTLGG